MIKTEKQKYVRDMLKAEKINKGTIQLFLYLSDMLEISEVLISTTSKLAAQHDCTERTIQRYIKTLKDYSYIHVKPHYNNDNPDKPYIEKNTYTLTPHALDLLQKATNYSTHDRAVNFNPGFFN